MSNERPRCEDCKAFRRDPQNLEEGNCTMDTPKVFPIPARGGIAFTTTWPTVRASQGCEKIKRMIVTIGEDE